MFNTNILSVHHDINIHLKSFSALKRLCKRVLDISQCGTLCWVKIQKSVLFSMCKKLLKLKILY